MLVFLDFFFTYFHALFIIFNIFGWIFKATRKIQFAGLILTSFSWFILGIWYGFGYCVCTDWHWEVRYMLGYADKSNSYIHFLILKVTGIDFPETFVINITFIVFVLLVTLSVIFNTKDFIKWRKNKRNQMDDN